MKKSEIEAHCTELVMPIIEEKGYDLWDVEWVKEGQDYYLRAYVDKEGGITIDDLVEVNHMLSDKLDEADKIDGAYILEVSSPGLTRPLKKDRDFERSIGKLVDVKLYKQQDGTKEFSGTLKGFSETTLTIDCEGNELTLDRQNISSVRLAFV